MSENATNATQANDCCPGNACSKRNTRAMALNLIVQMEWDFFQQVNNKGGRASCQDMPETFAIMRESQFSIWTDDMLLSYYDDLRAAQDDGRNPMTEKYAYMMESTHPDEFEQIKDALPPISQEKRDIIEQIVAIQISWAEEVAATYPHFAGRGRPIRSAQDSQYATSIETYSRGELATYSLGTLQLMLERFQQARDDNANLQMEVDTRTARSYGYASLAKAEEALSQA